MAQKQISVRGKVATELVEQFFLGRPVEIDDDVAAEYDVLGFSQTEVVFKQIEVLESDQRLDYLSRRKRGGRREMEVKWNGQESKDGVLRPHEPVADGNQKKVTL